MKRNILVLTPEYPADDLEKEFTPVVHLFTKEWVKLGYNVLVVNTPANFPMIMYKLARPFRRNLESLLGINIRTYPLSERKYTLEGVRILRHPVRKVKPHGRLHRREIQHCVESIISYCGERQFTPDIIIAHWTNPAIDLMLELKQHYNVPMAVTMHDAGYDFSRIYKNKINEIFSCINLWGFRNYPLKRQFEELYGHREKSYMCFSGVPEKYIVNSQERSFDKIGKYLFVGLLLKRKHPFELVQALYNSRVNDFTLDVVGQGDEAGPINKFIEEHPDLSSQIKLWGRVPRDDVSAKMRQADVFCMISHDEAFGLVYIEAMAAGCITIASRDEGFDGIIKDGENGFLCEAGNVEELTSIINKINKMDSRELRRISENAVKTANEMTETRVAKKYINEVERLLSL